MIFSVRLRFIISDDDIASNKQTNERDHLGSASRLLKKETGVYCKDSNQCLNNDCRGNRCGGRDEGRSCQKNDWCRDRYCYNGVCRNKDAHTDTLSSNHSLTTDSPTDMKTTKNSNIRTAVNLWTNNNSQAITAYEKIQQWQTTEVTNMQTDVSGSLNAPTILATTPLNNTNIHTAVDLWIDDNSKAITEYGDIQQWQTSEVTDMKLLFFNKTSFNGDIANWDVSKVTEMYGMFWNANAFNQDVSAWNTEKVTNMQGMFWNANIFNQDVSAWNTSKVTSMSGMFYNANTFNQDVSAWNINMVTSTSAMFKHANSFKQDLCGLIQENPEFLNGSDNRIMFYDTACPNTKDPTDSNACFNC